MNNGLKYACMLITIWVCVLVSLSFIFFLQGNQSAIKVILDFYIPSALIMGTAGLTLDIINNRRENETGKK